MTTFREFLNEAKEKWVIKQKKGSSWEVFETFDSKEEAEDSLEGMDLSAAEAKNYKISKTKG